MLDRFVFHQELLRIVVAMQIAGQILEVVGNGMRRKFERGGFPAHVIDSLRRRGHVMNESGPQGAAEIIVVTTNNVLEAGIDRRARDSAAAGF